MEGNPSLWVRWRWHLAFGLARLLRWGFGLFCCILAMVWGMAWLGEQTAFALALVVWWLMFYPAALIHELGHYAGARLGGMLVLSMRVGPLELAMRRRGFRLRWNRLPRQSGMGGYVHAIAGDAYPPFRQWLGFILGGPLANLAAAAVFALCGWLWQPHGAGWFCLMFAAMNAAVGFANLMPTVGKTASDGYWLVCLLLQGVEAEGAYARLYRLSLFGCTADRLPQADIDALDAEAFPSPLTVCWYRLKAAQNRGEWAQAAAMQTVFDEAVSGQDPQLLVPWREWLSVIRTELAFSRAMHAREADVLVDDLLSAEAAWWSPHLWPRCEALRAVLRGDRDGYAQWLARSRGYADNAVDRALPASEAMIRASMAQLG